MTVLGLNGHPTWLLFAVLLLSLGVSNGFVNVNVHINKVWRYHNEHRSVFLGATNMLGDNNSNKNKPTWSHAWLEGQRREKMYALTQDLQQAHEQSYDVGRIRSNWTSPATLAYINGGLDVLVQYSKLGDGDMCARVCSDLVSALPPRMLDEAQYCNVVVRAQRRVLHAYMNQFQRITYNPSNRRPLYKLSQDQKQEAFAVMVRAEATLAQMEQLSRAHVRAGTSTSQGVDGRVTTIPAPIMDRDDYTALIVGHAQLDQVVPSLSALRRIEQLHQSCPTLPRLKPALSVYEPICRALCTTTNPNLYYERMGIRYAPHEMTNLIGQDGLEAFRLAGITPPIQLYNHMLQAYSRVLPPPPRADPTTAATPFVDEYKQQQKDDIAASADNVLDQMLQDDVEPNTKTFTALIYTFVKSGWVPEAHAMMEGLMDYLLNAAEDAAAGGGSSKRLEKVDIRCVRLLANALAKEGAADQVQEIIFYMWALHDKGYDDCAPDVFLYTTAIKAWSMVQDGLEHAKALMDDMVEKRDLKPDVPMYNSLLSIICSQPFEGAAEHAGAIVMEMQTENLQPDLITYNTLMAACLNADNGLEKAEQTLHWMIRTGTPKPNARSYSQIIQAYVTADVNKSEYWLDRMEERFTPAPKLYETLILQWCQESTPQVGRAHALLERMEELHKAGGDGARMKPKRFLYNAVMRACQDQEKEDLAATVKRARDGMYANAKIEAVKYTSNSQVFALLDELDQDVGSIDNPTGTTVNFNVMLSYLAKSGEIWAGQRAEDVLNYMLELNLKRGNAAARPDIITFNRVMAAWAKSSHPEAGDKAVATLAKLDELHKMGFLEDVQADRVTYNTIMNAYAKSETANSAGMAENFFHELEGRYAATGDDRFQPDIISYTTLLNAHARSAAPGSAKRAEDILLQMIKVYQSDDSNVKPNTVCFNEVLYAWAKSQDPGALQRAEMLLTLMEDMHEAGNDDVAPNTRSYNIVLLAAGSGPKQDSAIRAQLFFDRMKESARIVPDAVSFNTIIEAYAKNGDEDTLDSISNLVDEAYEAEGVVLNSNFFSGVISSLSRVGLRGATLTAERIVQEIKTRNIDGEINTKMDTNIYNALINCWAKSGESEAPVRAEEILKLMEDESSKGNKKVKPDVQTYTSVIECWSKSTEPDAADRAESMLTRMVEEGHVLPSVHTYTTVIRALARSPHPDKAVRAQSILQRMKDDYRIAKNPGAQPTIVAYNALMNACEFTFGDIHNVEQAFKVACLAFDEMRQAPDLKLDHVTYGSFLGVINELVPKSDLRNEMIQLVFKRCCTDGQLGSLTLKKLKESAGPALYRDCLNGIREDNFPASWSCNVNEK